jgi:hypothetical protein
MQSQWTDCPFKFYDRPLVWPTVITLLGHAMLKTLTLSTCFFFFNKHLVDTALATEWILSHFEYKLYKLGLFKELLYKWKSDISFSGMVLGEFQINFAPIVAACWGRTDRWGDREIIF